MLTHVVGSERARRVLLIHLLSAMSQPHDPIRALPNGSPEGAPQPELPCGVRTPSRAGPGRTVLIVDDTATVRMFTKLILQREGYQLDEAKDGLEALAAIERRHPDLVLLDVVMPNLDGIECCRRLKASAETATIPVIIVTTRGREEQVQQAFEAGCDGFLTKPISKAELLQKIQSLLEPSAPAEAATFPGPVLAR